ncbi:hypothetical protein C2U69_21135 [Cupriavidus pinatubonensis]|nr:hypothetical protein C2U69_21135 [Cupriavidus pinatubonensis]
MRTALTRLQIDQAGAAHKLAAQSLALINDILRDKGLMLRAGSPGSRPRVQLDHISDSACVMHQRLYPGRQAVRGPTAYFSRIGVCRCGGLRGRQNSKKTYEYRFRRRSRRNANRDSDRLLGSSTMTGRPDDLKPCVADWFATF